MPRPREWVGAGGRPGTTPLVRLKLPDKNTDPDGMVCSACFNDFGIDLRLTDEWTEYTVPFEHMTQLPGWGSPHTGGIEPKALYAIQFQVNDKGQKYDIFVDDLAFTGCEASNSSAHPAGRAGAH